jgi:hypothetical protein
MAIGGYFIGGYWCVLMAIGCYSINGYWWLFCCKPLVVILLMVIDGHFITDY